MNRIRLHLAASLLYACAPSLLALPAAAQQGPFALPADHFLCYRGTTAPGDLALPADLQATLTDAFAAGRHYDVLKPLGICNPADPDDSGIADPRTHLTPYRIAPRDGEPAHVPVRSIRIFNRFGDILVDTIREDRVLVPAAKDAGGGSVVAPDPQSHAVDHYQCYRIRVARGSPRPPRGLKVSIEDQFETPPKIYDVRRPRLLCNPADKNGWGIKNPDGHFTCYRVRPSSGEPPHLRRSGVSTADQFVVHKLDTRRAKVLCVPSLRNPPAEFCGDSVVNQPPFEDCDGDAGVCQPGETCTAQCRCAATLGARTFSLDPAKSSFRTSFLGQTPVATPAGFLVLVGGALDETGTAPVGLADPPYYISVNINLGVPQTVCYEILSCAGSVHCSGGANANVLESLDSLSTDELGCVRDGTHACPDVPSSLCCSNACEGALVGSGNLPVTATGVGATDSGPGALVMTCNIRGRLGLPFGSSCALQDFSAAPVETHGLTTAIAAARVIQHCAGSGAPASVTPFFGVTGVSFECGTWTTENGPGTLVWALPTEEPTTFISGDGANAFIFGD